MNRLYLEFDRFSQEIDANQSDLVSFLHIIISTGVKKMSKWREIKPEQTYTDEQINQRLADELPNWFYENGWIRRKYKTHSWKGTLMVVNTIGHLAEVAWHHPDLTVSYAFVICKLTNHAAKGVTNKDFELAKKIEEVVLWQPDKEENDLVGTPKDQRFAYLQY